MTSSFYCSRTVALAICCALAACATKSGSNGPTLGGETRLRVAQAAEEAGDFPLADSMYAQAAAESPSDATAQLRYADVLVRQGKVTEARDLLLRNMKATGSPQALQSGLAAIYVLSGDAAGALIEYDKLLAARPDDMRLIVDKAVALDLLGRHDEAQSLYRRGLSASPGDAVVINDLALSLALSGRMQDATAMIAPLRDADDVSPRIRNNMQVVLAAGHKSDAALADARGTAIDQLAQALNRDTGKEPVRKP